MNAADLLKWYDDHIAAAEALLERYEVSAPKECVAVQKQEIARLEAEREELINQQAEKVLRKIRNLRERIEGKEGAK